MTTLKPILTTLFSLALAASSHAATTFLLNNSSPKTLASNQSDASVGLTTGSSDDGNNNGLDGDRANASTALTLSADDGGGTITFNTTDVSGNNQLVMDADSMGHGNDKWGANQNWTFNLDQTISFDSLTFSTKNETMILRSTAWVGDADATGSNWNFTTDATYGIFTLTGGTGTYDFTSAGVSNISAGEEIGFGFFASASGGEQLTSFTFTVIPESSASLLGGLGALLLLRRRRG